MCHVENRPEGQTKKMGDLRQPDHLSDERNCANQLCKAKSNDTEGKRKKRCDIN